MTWIWTVPQSRTVKNLEILTKNCLNSKSNSILIDNNIRLQLLSSLLSMPTELYGGDFTGLDIKGDVWPISLQYGPGSVGRRSRRGKCSTLQQIKIWHTSLTFTAFCLLHLTNLDKKSSIHTIINFPNYVVTLTMLIAVSTKDCHKKSSYCSLAAFTWSNSEYVLCNSHLENKRTILFSFLMMNKFYTLHKIVMPRSWISPQ